MVVGIDEARHDHPAAGVDLGGVAGMQVRADGEDLLAMDQDVASDEVPDLRVHGHHVAVADDIAPVRLAGALGRVVMRQGRAGGEQTKAGGGDGAGRGRTLEKTAP